MPKTLHIDYKLNSILYVLHIYNFMSLITNPLKITTALQV